MCGCELQLMRDNRYELLWRQEKISLIINIQRDEKEMGLIKFSVSPSEYFDIMNLQGAHKGFLVEYEKEIVFSLFPTDILIIISDDYKEVEKAFMKKITNTITTYKGKEI